MCIFCKIVSGEIPSKKVYEDERVLVIEDINPQAKVHYLLIPKEHYANIVELSGKNSDLLAYSFNVIKENYRNWNLEEGFRLITNCGSNGCQSVEHIHIHILGGEKLSENMG